jgi:Flp pilus assembly pilin Flp
MVKTLILTLSAGRALRVTASLGNDNRAVTALEYGSIASILGLVLVGIFTSFGKTLTTLFSHVSTSI